MNRVFTSSSWRLRNRFTKIDWCYPVLHGTFFQVAQIYKDASVGNPVSVAVVKVEILQVRKARK